MLVAVGSENPVKIAAVRDAFVKVFPKTAWVVRGLAVASGVSDQPMSKEESIKGARQRALATSEKVPEAEYVVGLEGGVEEIGGKWFDCGWIVVRSRKGEEGIGSTIHMQVPEKMMEQIREGKELGIVTDVIFAIKNSKQQAGHFGLMTNGAVDRKSAYRDGVISALARFLQEDLFV